MLSECSCSFSSISSSYSWPILLAFYPPSCHMETNLPLPLPANRSTGEALFPVLCARFTGFAVKLRFCCEALLIAIRNVPRQISAKTFSRLNVRDKQSGEQENLENHSNQLSSSSLFVRGGIENFSAVSFCVMLTGRAAMEGFRRSLRPDSCSSERAEKDFFYLASGMKFNQTGETSCSAFYQLST